MSAIGPSSVETSLIQAAQAQQVASRSRDREKAVTDRARRLQDLVELQVNGVVSAEALRRVPQNDSEQAESEHRRQSHERPAPRPERVDDRPSIDLTA